MRNRPRRMNIYVLSVASCVRHAEASDACRLKQPSPACLPGFKNATDYLPVKRGYHTESHVTTVESKTRAQDSDIVEQVKILAHLSHGASFRPDVQETV
ncbi:hypothetical protein LXL04_030794 [Taraxacum kok-saghyz]